MKTRKIVLSLLISVLMVASICLGVACEPKEVKIDLSTATLWKPAVAEGEEDVYKASNKDGALVLDFAKDDSYNATCVPFATFTVDELSKVKTLVVTAKMTTDAPYPALLFKVEGVEDKDAKRPGAVEVKVKATATETTYEWDFGYLVDEQKQTYDLTKVTRFLIFADPGVVGSSGTITISSIYLTDKDVTEANDATKKPAESGTAPAPVWNEVTATNMAIGSWVDGTPNSVYTVTKNTTDNSYKVDVNKKVGAGQWDALVSYIHGDALKTAKSFKLVVKGTKDKQILVKPFDSFEKRITLTGENQEININVNSFIKDNADEDFSKKDAPTKGNKVCIIGLPDVVKGTDTFTIISAEFSTELYVDPNVNEITETSNAILSWKTADAYTNVTNEEGTLTATIGKNEGWAAITADVYGSAIGGFDQLKVTLGGINGVPFVIKTWDNVEHCYDGRDNAEGAIPTTDSTTVTLTVPAGDYAETVRTLIIMINVNNQAKDTATVTVNAEFARTPNAITAENKKVTKWYGADAGIYTITHNTDGSIDVAKSAAGWQQLKADVSGAALANMKTFRMTISGIKTENIIIKPFDKVEAKYEPATEDTINVIVDLTGITGVDFEGGVRFLF